MKKQFLIIGTFLTFGLGFSQNTFPTATGTNVGIGTATPSTRLQITSATAGTSGVRLTNLTSASSTTPSLLGKALSVDGAGNLVLVPVVNTSTPVNNIYATDGTLSKDRTVTMDGKNLTFNPTIANSQFFINGTNGNVGIGNIIPSSKLEVSGILKANQGVFNSTSLEDGQTFTSGGDRNDKCAILAIGKTIGSGSGYNNTRMFNFFDFPVSNLDSKSSVFFGIEDRNDSGRYRFIAETGGTTNLIVLDKTQTEVFKVFDDGNNTTTLSLPKANSFLGIGTTNFTDGSDTYRISVKGAIRADRVRVYTTWADYVFNKEYNLPSLEEVEQHIKDNGHLKDIPSAKEVEEKGIELGEMNKLLLQKIEELTLYIIEMNKEINTLKSKN